MTVWAHALAVPLMVCVSGDVTWGEGRNDGVRLYTIDVLYTDGVGEWGRHLKRGMQSVLLAR